MFILVEMKEFAWFLGIEKIADFPGSDADD